jgi:hypothetical protein
MARPVAFVRASGLASLACAVAACAEPRAPTAAETECHLRVVVGFVAPSVAIDLVALGVVAGARFALVERLLPDLAVLDLSANGGDASCVAALERLRRAPTVRSAEPEQRRAPNPG